MMGFEARATFDSVPALWLFTADPTGKTIAPFHADRLSG